MTQQSYFCVFLLRKWKLVFRQNLYMNIYSNFIYNNLKAETIQQSFNEWMDKQTALQPYNKNLLSNIKE